MQTMARPQCGASFDEVCNRAVDFANRHGGGIEQAEEFIDRAGWGGEHFGIEYVSTCGRELAYLNTGDTYNTTVCQERNEDSFGEYHGEVFSGSWGGWIEEVENEHTEETGEVSCGYCGEWTEADETDWRLTVCNSCGRYVDCGEFPEEEEEEEED
jgi:hypothetical protein